MEVPCIFRSVIYEETGESFCLCAARKKTIPDDKELTFKGTHEAGKNNQNVNAIAFFDCQISKVPQGLTKTFPNLIDFVISNSNLKNIINADLEEYKNIKRFVFKETELEYLPGNLFHGFENMETISFNFNKLKFIEPNLFDGLSKLKHANFHRNTCINKCYNHTEKLPKETIENVKNELLNYFKSISAEEKLEIAEVRLKAQELQANASEDKLNREIQKLKASEENLKRETGILKIGQKFMRNKINIMEEALNHQVQKENDLIQLNNKLLMEVQNLKSCKKRFKKSIRNLKKSNVLLKHANQSMVNNGKSLIREFLDLKNVNKDLVQENLKIKNSETILSQQIKNMKISESKLSLDVEILRKLEAELKQKLKDLKLSEEFSTQEVQRLRTSEEKLCREIQNLKITSNKLSKCALEDQKPATNPQDGIYSDLKNLIQDDHFKDFTITIDDRKFLIHKFLLAARSSTLAEMFRVNPNAESLNLVDISIKTFEVIHKFLYTDELPQDDEVNFLPLYEAAGRLKIGKLQNLAGEKLAEQICSENALDVLNLSHKNEDNVLSQKAFNQIKKSYPLVMFKDEWITQPKKVIQCIKKFEEHVKKFQMLSDDSTDE